MAFLNCCLGCLWFFSILFRKSMMATPVKYKCCILFSISSSFIGSISSFNHWSSNSLIWYYDQSTHSLQCLIQFGSVFLMFVGFGLIIFIFCSYFGLRPMVASKSFISGSISFKYWKLFAAKIMSSANLKLRIVCRRSHFLCPILISSKCVPGQGWIVWSR